MLTKLMKHEFKAQARLLLPLLLVLTILTMVNCIVFNLDVFTGALSMVRFFIGFAYGASIVAVIIISSVIIILRFYKNLMTDEGYLMFTLPVKSHQLINSKLIISIIWNTICFVAVLASVYIVIVATGNLDGFKAVLNSIIEGFKSSFGEYSGLFIVEMTLSLILGVINSVLMIYVSIAIGQLVTGHKILGAFGAYIAIYTVVQIITTVAMVLAGFLFRKSFDDMASLPTLLMPTTIAFILVVNVAFYFVTNYIFKRKLNLD